MTDSTHASKAHTRIFLFSHPRTRSNLFIRLLGTHPQIISKQYPFMHGFQKGPENQWPDEIKEELLKALGETKEEGEKKYAHLTFQAGLDDIEKFLAEAQEKGKFGVIKEHSYYTFDSRYLNSQIGFASKDSEKPRPVMVDRKLDVIGPEVELDLPSPPFPNPTMLPDRLVATMSPVIIIRHPIFTYPSYVRAFSVIRESGLKTEFSLMATYRWQRIIYDFYRAYYNQTDPAGKKDWPVVIDGDKLVEDTEGQMKKFCALVGLTESEIQYSWDSLGRPTDRFLDSFMGTINESTGVIKGSVSLAFESRESSGIPELNEQVKKWTAEWNEEVARKIEEAVESSIGDYEYLKARSL
ncbi:hypothetical protein GYMLUDRAFT_151596 [Collybiopsis luxurians FD-317 M1]|nr:hypothetical protein GYMLUDRAFT_151596 [Collybiopsis luxurians FD-317 M1]